MGLIEEPVIILDGACGTSIQRMEIPPAAWAGNEGCNEYLNLSAPDAIRRLHASFFEAGAMVVETNTFGATRIVLGEYGLGDRTDRINRAAVENARAAAGGLPGRHVAGSIGPTTKLVSLGQVSREDLERAYAEQMGALLDAGVDCFIIETCQDLLQIKTAIVTCFEVMEKAGRSVPVLVSVTVETTGTLLVGSDIAAVAAAVEPFPILSLGLNCATGPADMESHIRHLSRIWPRRISCIPNAGLPEVVGGATAYPLEPDPFAAHLAGFVGGHGVSIVGGCCGTTPDHIRALVEAVREVLPAPRDVAPIACVASLYQAVELTQDPPPLMIGERANANGSKRFRERLLADDIDGELAIVREQEDEGAHLVDLCTAYAGRDEMRDLTALARRVAESIRVPAAIDSTSSECIEACLRIYPGRPMVNSVHLEDGGANLARICAAARKHGAAVIALTIDESGMAMRAAAKVETAVRIHDLAVNRHGLRPHDLLFDALTFTVGSGDATLRDAAIQTIEGIKGIKARLPGVRTILGVSNISFGLPPASRRILNSVFLHEAVAAGLDAAIIDVAKIVPLAEIPEEDRRACLDLLYDRAREGEPPPLEAFIARFQGRADRPAGGDAEPARSAEAELAAKIVAGDREGLDDLLAILLERRRALAIINEILVPAMRRVGDLFASGEMLLPFVLKSAEAMKASVACLEPFMDRSDRDQGLKVLLATVQGDVHDIGKNLVDIILSNNGYRVYNLGIKVPAEAIIAKARELGVDVIGLSGLLVKSALVMKENMPQFAAAGLTQPILLGGAALTAKFVAQECVPRYGGTVTYCQDAFGGLKAMQDFEAGRLVSTAHVEAGGPAAAKPGPQQADLDRSAPVPAPPFLGSRAVTDGIDPSRIFRYVNEQALFRGRWGYRRAKLSATEYKELVAGTVLPLYERLKLEAQEERWFEPRVAYGYFRCRAEGERLLVDAGGDGDATEEFAFPRQAAPPYRCIADYFKAEAEGGDIVGFFVVTLGDRIGEVTRKLFEEDRYHDYLMVHGFSVEVTDALAEYWHEVMREDLGIGGRRPAAVAGYVTQEYQGSRYGFGYPACPDLEAHRPLFRLLRPERIGVSLTETMEMVPEQTTSAIVAHHPQAKYFAV